MSDYINCLNNSIISDTTKISIYDESYVEKLKKENEELKQIVLQLERKQVKLPERYIINENACILFWQNGEKTVVKRCTDDKFNPRLAFLTAFFQHYVDMSKNKANKYLANLQVEVESKQNPKHMKEEAELEIENRVEIIKEDSHSKKGWKGKITEIDTGNDIFQVNYDNGEKWWVSKEQIKLIKEENR